MDLQAAIADLVRAVTGEAALLMLVPLILGVLALFAAPMRTWTKVLILAAVANEVRGVIVVGAFAWPWLSRLIH